MMVVVVVVVVVVICTDWNILGIYLVVLKLVCVP
jgi:hypothetical protein